MMSNDIRIFCRPCDFEIAKQLIAATEPVIVPKEWQESYEKIDGSVGYETDKMVKVSEQEFLSTIVDRSGVTVEKVGYKHKHYLFCGNHYASKIKGRYWVVDSVYKEIVTARNENE